MPNSFSRSRRHFLQGLAAAGATGAFATSARHAVGYQSAIGMSTQAVN
jgi:hypothetical protein